MKQNEKHTEAPGFVRLTLRGDAEMLGTPIYIKVERVEGFCNGEVDLIYTGGDEDDAIIYVEETAEEIAAAVRRAIWEGGFIPGVLCAAENASRDPVSGGEGNDWK